jgi:hypothetical protein
MRPRKLSLHQISSICVHNLHILPEISSTENNVQLNRLFYYQLFYDHGRGAEDHNHPLPVCWELIHESEEV